MAIDNVIDPTNCNPYSTASGDNKRACPKGNMVDIKAEIRRSLLISFVFSNPDDNYKVLLSEGSKEIWEIDYVKDGELKRAAGKVRNFEYWTNKHIGLSTYSANGVIQRDEKVVVKFDASIDFKNQLISIDVRNIRGLKPAGVIEDSELIQDSAANFIKVSKNAYNFLKVAYPKEFATLTKLDNALNTDDTEYTDYMFDGALALNELAPLNLKKVKSANYMFRNNENLRQVQLTTSDALATAKGMFEGCSKLEQVEITTAGLQNAEAMFKGCQSLKALKLDVSSLTNAKDMFKDATALTTLRLKGKLGTGLDLSNSPLDNDSIASVLAAMSENGPDEDKTVRFKGDVTVNGALKAIADGAIKAGWVLTGLTYGETTEDAQDDKLSKDIVDSYEEGKKEDTPKENTTPTTGEDTHTEAPVVTPGEDTHTEQPATGEDTHTEQPAAPVVTPGEETHTEQPAAPTTGEDTHTESPVVTPGEETHTESPVVTPAQPEAPVVTPGEETHTETPVVTPGEETHAESPVNTETQPTAPVVTPGEETHTEKPEETEAKKTDTQQNKEQLGTAS